MRTRINHLKILIATLPLLTILVFPPHSAFAQTPPPATPPTAPAATTPGSTKLTNPLGEGTTVEQLLGRAIQIITGVSGSVALLMFVYGGFTWMTSQGSSEKVKKGKQIFITATLGLIIIFGSYAMVNIVLSALKGNRF